MSGKNVVEQIVKLNIKGYVENLRKFRAETREAMGGIDKETFKAGRNYDEFTNNVKKNSAASIASLSKLGKSFAENLYRGSVIGGAALLAKGLNAQLNASVKTGLEFSRSFAQLASRADLSKNKLKDLREEIKKLGKTGADLGSLPEAVSVLYGATGSVDKSMSVMDPIAKVAAMGNGNAAEIATFAKDQLKGQGKDVNSSNVESLLHSLVLATRNGEFANLDDAMAGYKGLDPSIRARAGLSDRETAALMSGATHTGTDRETSMAGLNALMRSSVDEISGNNVLGSILGIKSLQTNGKFDINRLKGTSVDKLPGSTDNQKIKLLAETGGMSEQEATGVFNFIKNFGSMKEGVDKTLKDQKSLTEAVDQATDNLSDKLTRLRNKMVTGFSDIVDPLEGVAKDLVDGNFGKAIGGAPKAIAGSLQGAADNPALVAGAIGATILAGGLAKKLPKLFGGGAAETAAGVAKGNALKAAGVTPVYMTNAGEIARSIDESNKAGSYNDKMYKAMGGAGAGGSKGAGRITGALGKVAGAFMAYEAGAVVGELANPYIDAGLKKTNEKDQYGRDWDGFERILLRLGFGPQGLKFEHKIEVDSKDPGFLGKPKAADLMKDGR